MLSFASRPARGLTASSRAFLSEVLPERDADRSRGLRAAYVKGVADAQRVAREAVLCVAQSVQPATPSAKCVLAWSCEFRKARVEHWLHTPYAWWGERTCFDWRGLWETNALPSDRALLDGEAFRVGPQPPSLPVSPLILRFQAAQGARPSTPRCSSC